MDNDFSGAAGISGGGNDEDPRPPSCRRKIRRVLIVKPSSLGDIIDVFPALELLRQNFPEAKVDFLIHPTFVEALDYSPWRIARRIRFDRKALSSWKTFFPAMFRLIRQLRRKKYDLVIDFQGLMRSAWFAALAKGGPVVGFAAPRERAAGWFYARRFPVGARHAVDRNLELARRIIAAYAGKNADSGRPDFEPPANPLRLLALGRLPEHYLAVVPGARWPSKTFAPRHFAEVLTEIHRKFPELVFAAVGSAADRAAVRELEKLLPETAELQDFTGRTSLGGMMELLRSADAVVCNDSGPMHAASLLKRPVFAFFGPTDPGRTGPWSPESHVYSGGAPCAPCRRRVCPRRGECQEIDTGEAAVDLTMVLRKTNPVCEPAAKAGGSAAEVEV